MVQRIWKFPLEITRENHIEMPKGSIIMCVKMQNDIPCVWAICESGKDVPKETKTILTFGTGHPLPSEMSGKYIGTYLNRYETFVGHVFEQLEEG